VVTLVKVTFKPWEEVIIHEAIRYSLEDLVKLLSIGVPPGGRTSPVLWAKGVIFTLAAMPPATSEIIKEQLEGKIHYAAVQWASMPEYKKEILIEDLNARIPIAYVSASPILCDVAEALKEES